MWQPDVKVTSPRLPLTTEQAPRTQPFGGFFAQDRLLFSREMLTNTIKRTRHAHAGLLPDFTAQCLEFRGRLQQVRQQLPALTHRVL